MTRISHSHVLGASKRLPPRITLLASSNKFKFKEERKRILKLSVKKLRSIEDPEAFLSKSVLINNTLKRLQTEVREEKAERKKCAELPDYNPSPYSFYSIEKAYREEMERLDNNGNNPDSTSSFGAAAAAAVAAAAALSANHQSNNSATCTMNSEPCSAYVSLHAQRQTSCNDDMDDQHMLDADDEDSGSDRGADSSTSSTSGDSSSSEDEECEEMSNSDNTISMDMRSDARIEENSSSLSSASAAPSLSVNAPPSIGANENNANSAVSINEINSVEDDLLSEVYMPTPSMPPPHDPIDDHGSGLEPCTLGVIPMRPSTPVPWSTPNNKSGGSGSGVSKLLITNNPSAEAVIKSSEISGCDNEVDIWSEAVRTECWTKPVDTPANPPLALAAPSSVSIRTTLTASSTVNTNSMSHHWPSVDWPTYTPSTGGPCSVAASESSANSIGIGQSANTPIAALSASNLSAAATSAAAASNFNPNISALPISMQCANSHKENLFSATVHTTSTNNQNSNLASNHNHHNQNHVSTSLDMSSCDNRSKANPSPLPSHAPAPSSLSDKCYSCGQSSLFQSELQSVVFSSLIASLET